MRGPMKRSILGAAALLTIAILSAHVQPAAYFMAHLSLRKRTGHVHGNQASREI